MGLKDSDDPRNAFLYKLSRAEGLNWFKHIVLFSSPQDTYSPFDSSRIQVSQKNQNDYKSVPAYIEMVENILNKVKCKKVLRVDLCMKFNKTTMDTFIGRAAHISLISDSILLEMLAYRYSHLL